MANVDIPETVLRDSGVSQRYWEFSLTKLKADPNMMEQYRKCCRFTSAATAALKRGMGVCLYGPDTDARRNAFYGVAKALIAQNRSVLCIDIEDVIQAHSEKSELYTRCSKVDLLAFPEMDLPSNMVNNYYKSIIYKLIKKRSGLGKSLLVATALEVIHPDFCVDVLFPGVGAYIVEDTLLVNFDETNQCEWLRKGHKMNMASLMREPSEIVKKARKPRKVNFKKKKT